MQCVDRHISKTLLSQNLRQDLSVDSGRTRKARVELKLGHELLFTKEIFNITLFHLAIQISNEKEGVENLPRLTSAPEIVV